MKHQTFQKGIAVNDKESRRNASTQKMEGKSRIKQKSLSAIFAKKLKDTNPVAHKMMQQLQISSQVKNATAEVTEIRKIKQFDTIDKKTLTSNKISSIVSSDITNEPIVSFTKPTKGHIGKTLLARKRNTSKNEQKRSLSDIFSSQVKNQTQLNVSTIQKHDIDKNSVQNREPEIVAEEPFASKNKKKRIEKNRQNEKDRNIKIIRKHREKIINDDRESEKTPRLPHRASGKISSLFGNNPDIPTIGQRFVKPVNEPIFTEVTFEDLNIHSFMVSLSHIYLIHLLYGARTFIYQVSIIFSYRYRI